MLARGMSSDLQDTLFERRMDTKYFRREGKDCHAEAEACSANASASAKQSRLAYHFTKFEPQVQDCSPIPEGEGGRAAPMRYWGSPLSDPAPSKKRNVGTQSMRFYSSLRSDSSRQNQRTSLHPVVSSRDEHRKAAAAATS